MRLTDPDTLFEEVAFVAYHFGWSHDDVLSLPHWERRRWCDEISQINERMNETVVGDAGDTRDAGGSFLDDEGGGMVLQNSLEDR